MTCDDVQEDLELFVLGEIQGVRAEAIRAHLARCDRCRQAEEDTRLLLCEIRLSADRPRVRPSFEQAVRAAGVAEIGAVRRRARVRRVIVAAGAMAAVLVLGAGLWGLLRARRPAQTAPGRGPEAAVAPERWRYTGPQVAPASPADGVVVQGGSMYLLSSGHGGSHVVAIDAETGSQRWVSDVHCHGYLSADGSRVFCLALGPAAALDLVALSVEDGKELWRYAGRAPRRLQAPSRPVALGADRASPRRSRVCWTNGGAVHVLDATTGKCVWTRSFPHAGALSAAVAGGEKLYVASGRALHCLDADSGRPAWTQAFPRELRGHGRPLLALADGRVYLAQTQVGGRDTGVAATAPVRRLASRPPTCRLFCMGLAGRRLIWQEPIPAARCLLATGGRLYVRAERILALNGATGRRLWVCAAGGCGPLTLSDGLICFVDSSRAGRLVALEQHTGRKAWEILGIRSCDAFRRVGTTGYIKTHDGTVRAIALAGLAGS